MWRLTRNNGITQGFHNKMQLINREAYGFRNFQNYRLPVRYCVLEDQMEAPRPQLMVVEPPWLPALDTFRTFAGRFAG